MGVVSLLQSFVWWRDPQRGFTLLDAHSVPNPDFGKSMRPLPTQPRSLLAGLSGVAPERRVDTESKFFEIPARISRGSDKLERYEPAAKYRGQILLRKFAKIETAKGMCDFVNDFGPLTQSGLEHGEDPAEGIELARKARDLLRAHRAEDHKTIRRELGSSLELPRRVTAFMVPDSSSCGARLQMELSDLYSFIWFQLAEALAGDRPSLRECLYCGKWFEVGPDSPGKKRKDSDFCKPEHKTAFHNANRPKGK